MKNLLYASAVLLSQNLFSQQVPKVLKTDFPKEILTQKITASDGKKLEIYDILKYHEGKILIIDFWASWCKDCIAALPETKILKEKNSDVDFVYFSLDRSSEQWKKGLEKFEISANENYWFDEGWKKEFQSYIDLNWIPRFIIVDQKGKIAKYYAVDPNDPEIQKTINDLKS